MDSFLDFSRKRFRTSWFGLDKQEVEVFCRQILEEIQRLKGDNYNLKRDLQEAHREIKEYKDREKAIRNVLVNAQKAAESLKENAEKEARLIVAEAELKSEKVLHGAHQRLAQLQDDIAELKRIRIQMETRLRSTIESYSKMLDMDKDEEREPGPENKVAYLNRSTS